MTQREAAFKGLTETLAQFGVDTGPGQIDVFYLNKDRHFYHSGDPRRRLIEGLSECFDHSKLRNLTVAQIRGLEKALGAAYSLGIQNGDWLDSKTGRPQG